MNEILAGDLEEYTIGYIPDPAHNMINNGNSDKTIGRGYTFDRSTGLFNLTDTIDNVSISDDYIGYYTCDSAENTNCSHIYKIGDSHGEDAHYVSMLRSLNPGHSYVLGITAYSSTTVSNKLYSKSGLYKTVDYDGDAYYFRGNIKNNYVSFANRLWKIIRVNGDGSIRIIADSKVGNSGFSSGSNKKRAGYTYDNKDETGNDLACTSTNPCVSDYDSVNEVFVNNRNLTDNKIKTYLENWYLDNLKQYDGDIVVNNYCNDTTNTANSSGTSIYYGALNRISNGNPSLICPDTPETYGGYYRLKIGLINADELNMAGLNILSTVSGDFCLNCTGTFRDNADSSNYLYYDEYWHTMTPESGTASSARLLYGYQGSFRYYNAYTPITSRPVRPVINLRSDIQITSGDGSQTNPYVVE